MARILGESIVVTDGYWNHIRCTRVYHRHSPEVRGEGWSLGDATLDLARQLACALEAARGSGRHEAIERALTDVRGLRSPGRRPKQAPVAVVS